MGLYPGIDNWDANVHYVESEDPGQGGFNGVSNIARIQLANRTEYLRQRVTEHSSNTSNPHGVTKAQLGLGSVLNAAQLQLLQNLADVQDKAAARSNLDVYPKASIDSMIASLMRKDSNLNDLVSKPTARTNLDVYSKGEADTLLGQKLTKASNLSDLTYKPTARSNLGVYSTGEVDTLLSGKSDTSHTHLDITNWGFANPTDSRMSNCGIANMRNAFGMQLIIQWGMILSAHGTNRWYYPATYPNTAFVIIGSQGSGGVTDVDTLFILESNASFLIKAEDYNIRQYTFLGIGW